MAHSNGRLGWIGALRLVSDEPPPDRLAAIHTNPHAIIGDPEDLVSLDWSEEWDADQQMQP